VGDIVDLYAGPGGWSEALRALGRGADELGLEYDDAAVATRTAAGHRTLQADIGDLDHMQFDGEDLEGLIASPPCQGFSTAGAGAARNLIPELLASIHARRWNDRADPDPRVWLIVNLGRWLEELAPRWIALEQVPSVLPIWEAYADLLRTRGYSVWTGILNAANFGVPQTRRRAILIASLDRTVHPPEPTHDRAPVASLFGTTEPWVTMGEALNLDERFRIGFPRLDDIGDSPDGYRERDWRNDDEPSFTVTEKARSWIRTALNPDAEHDSGDPAPTVTTRADQWTLNTGRAWLLGGSREDAQTIDPGLEPAPTLTAKSGGQWHLRANANANATVRRSDRLTIVDALLLQSFRADYPVQGTKTKQFEQIGNAIPPRLAEHVLRSVLP